jgi:hypothetical protein
MKREITAARLIAATFVALGFALGGTLLTGAPASAQETPQATPWYMPQPWVHPPKTGPNVRKLRGYYGHNYRGRSYGSFSTSCYGDCGIVRGTVRTGYGVTLSQPVVVIFDPRAYKIVPRSSYVVPPGYAVQRASAQFRPQAAVPARTAQRAAEKPLPKFSVQNGVRIIRPAPITTY